MVFNMFNRDKCSKVEFTCERGGMSGEACVALTPPLTLCGCLCEGLPLAWSGLKVKPLFSAVVILLVEGIVII